jgi:hypothetical protein
MSPELLDDLFPIQQQRHYVTMLEGRGGLTRRRAEYFVKLWGYLRLKELEEVNGSPPKAIDELQPSENLVACTHREAAEIFYSNMERGSDRAAGMMIDRLAELGLIEKRYDGQSLALKVRSLPELKLPDTDVPVQLIGDLFNPRVDAIPVANLHARSYAGLIRDGAVVAKITRVLREWSQRYPNGMRVLRRSDNQNVIAASSLFPVAVESESNFFQAPSKSFFLTTDAPVDPFQMAPLGDPNCTAVYMRTWMIDPQYMNGETIYKLFVETKKILLEIQKDYPNVCDIYTLAVHPIYEGLGRAMGFKRIYDDPQRSYGWVYLAIDRFLETDFKEALINLRIENKS